MKKKSQLDQIKMPATITAAQIAKERTRQKAADKAAMERIKGKFEARAEVRSRVPLTPSEREELIAACREAEKRRKAKD